MIVNSTYEAARLDAIHILSAYDKFPVTITITPREHNGKIKWYLDYKEQFQDEEDDEE